MSSEKSFTAQVTFPNPKELNFVLRAVAIDSLTLSAFLRNAGVQKAREIFQKVGYKIPLDFYDKNSQEDFSNAD